MRTYQLKNFLYGAVVAIATLLFAAVSILLPFGGVQTARAAGGEVTLVAEVSDLITGQANPEFTIMLKFENNNGTIGGAQLVITPLDDNVVIGSSDANYVAGDTWLAANAGAVIVNEKNINLIGTDDAGITKNSFSHGGYKFKYSGTPTGPIAFNIALISVYDENVDEITVKFNNQTLTENYELSNLTVTPRALETTNTLSGLTLSAGGTQILSGTEESQTVSAPIANADKATVKLTATRAGAASKIKVEEGGKTIVAEQTGDVAEVSLGDLQVGEHTLTITVTSESGEVKTYTVKFTVAEPLATPITKPAAAGTTTGGYSGSAIDFTPDGMAELVSSGKVKLYSVSESGAETEAGIDAFKPTNAGTYKIVARPADGFCWEGSDSADAEYSFTVKKATLSASAAEAGKLPTFTSDSYKGSLDGIVTYKYYSDAACTQEVAANNLTAGQNYYVKAVLKDGAEGNFEFGSDSVTQGYINSGFTFTPADTQGGNSQTILGLPFWAWIIIAVVAILLILILILFLVKRNKKEERAVVQSAVSPAELQHPQSAVVQQEIAATEAKTEKLEDRMRAMEKEASEREVTRYKEEAERAERKAEKNEAPAVAVAPIATTVTDSAAQERVKELEARMHEMEKEASEREVVRYKEEAERAEKKAEQAAASAVAPVAATAADSAAQERVKELEARMREMEKEAHEKELTRYKEEAEAAKRAADERLRMPVTMATGESERVKELEARLREMERDAREAERSAHERELARFKDDVEQARRVAEQSQKGWTPTSQPAAASTVGAVGESERVKELEARVREMEKSAQEREIARYKEEAERAKRAAEERYYAQHPIHGTTYVPYHANDEQASSYVQKLEEQLRKMEQEAHERELARYRNEAERAKKEAEDLMRRSRRQEEELNRLRELQTMEQRSREIAAARNTGRGSDSENGMLQRMEEQMRRQNAELQALTDELARRLASMQNNK